MKVVCVDLHHKNIHNAICFKIKNFFKAKNTFRFFFVKYGKIHNEKFAAEYNSLIYKISPYTSKYYHLYNYNYGPNFSNKQWVKKAKQLKRKNKLKVFL